MKKIFLILILCVFSVSLFANGEIMVPYLKTAPVIDGIINESEWADSTGLSGFLVFKRNLIAENKSFVYLGYDNKNLYIAYRCYSGEAPRAFATGDIWPDDDMEFYITPDKNKLPLYQILVNATGYFRYIGFNTEVSSLDIVSKGHISEGYERMGAEAKDKYWEGELALSFESMGINKLSKDVALMIHRHIYGSANYDEGESNIFIDAGNNYFEEGKLLDVSKHSHLVFGDIPGVQMTDNFGTSFKGNLDNVTLTLTKENEVLYEGPVKEGLYETLPQGIYVLGYSVKRGNESVLKSNQIISKVNFLTYTIENNILKAKFDFSTINQSVPVFFTISSGEKVFAGSKINITENKKQYECEYDLSGLKGEYDLSFSIGTIYKNSEKITL